MDILLLLMDGSFGGNQFDMEKHHHFNRKELYCIQVVQDLDHRQYVCLQVGAEWHCWNIGTCPCLKSSTDGPLTPVKRV